MHTQANAADIATKKRSLTNISSISEHFAIAEVETKAKCLLWESMHGVTGTGTIELETDQDFLSLLHFPHNIDSQLGTGRIKAQRKTLPLERPPLLAQRA